jgi:hypothetical protein
MIYYDRADVGHSKEQQRSEDALVIVAIVPNHSLSARADVLTDVMASPQKYLASLGSPPSSLHRSTNHSASTHDCLL